MKGIFIRALQRNARRAIAIHQPMVIAITGSVGKTSTKQAIYTALEPHFHVRTAKKNYNNEIGVPLAVFGEESPGSSLFSWLRLLMRTRSVKEMPDVLILEFGVDHPGDIAKLCEIAPPMVAVVTGVSTVHAEYFENMEQLAEEKASLITFIPEDGFALLNHDDSRVKAMAEKTIGKVIRFGSTSHEYGVEDIRITTREDEDFNPGEIFATTTAFVKKNDGVIGQLQLRNVLGYAPVMACLAAIALAGQMHISPMSVIKDLNRKMMPAPGRLNPIAGIKGSLIIDDSYNAAPVAVSNGLQILKMFNPGEEYDRRIAVIGHMAELGKYTLDEHRMVGLRAAESADLFIAVGESMHTAVAAAKEAGMDPDAVEWFGTSVEAGRYLDKVIQEGDIVYVKGSQSARMERVVKDIMAEPLRASELLVRQEKKWLMDDENVG